MPDIPCCIARRGRYALHRAAASLINLRDRWRDPAAARFFQALVAEGFDPEAHIDVLPQQRLIYLCVPKSASTTIKAALAAIAGRTVPPHRLHARRHSGLSSPRHVGISTFHHLATNPRTLRFSFVRNPYARLVSAWADKYRGRPLVAGDDFVDQYLAYRRADGRPPVRGSDETLSFADFVAFACATADARLNAHWAVQDDMVTMPGIALDFIGKVETFGRDFARVIDHIDPRRQSGLALAPHHNISAHAAWQRYYDDALAARVHRAYERDFDRFGYARAIG